MKQLILHIPHASTHIPNRYGYLVSNKGLNAELQKLTDWYTDELFANNQDEAVIAPFSRVFCDVERFTDDSLEPMAKYGMGVLYEKTDEGKPLRQVSAALRCELVEKYYNVHHQRLTEAVERQLTQHNSALLIDCHSFPDVPLQRDLDKSTPRPDFNLGTDAFHTSPELAKHAKQFFVERGFTVEINRPYAGTLVPMRWYNNDKRVSSLMLEVNRRLYLENGTKEKSSYFNRVQMTVQQFLDTMRQIRGI
ncbi:N-formylglutamate amidohydrolase [uncultured Draconibacterium sp.]|uniref:N-formylglutamate amidohydrolase n=1 Tax=uncultured Draconibacterium sp. TaxID=1573823 RepID=UPI002AA6FDFE|nr:N-formylglutamate amidohydrolase [uncultured Draconibacterium sp.]